MRFFVFGLVTALAALAQTSGFYLHPGDRVVFYGDSITDQRLYTTFVETFVVTRFPKMPITFVHSGWGGDRVTSGGGGPIDVRLDRDVSVYKPTVMTVMLGMNDGEYKPFDQATFDKYASGYRHLIEEVRKHNPGLRITVIEPSPFDDFTRAPRFPGGYNKTLERYSQFVRSLAKEDRLTDADLNAPVVRALLSAKGSNPDLAQKLIPDSVHPAPAGHLIMAQALLKDWHAPGVVSNVVLDAANGHLLESYRTKVRNLVTQTTIRWDQEEECLPFPIDWSDKSGLVQLAVKSSNFLDELNREFLTVQHLSAPQYALKIDDMEAGRFSAADLGKGINLASLANTPMMKQALSVHAVTLQRTGVHNFLWRNIRMTMEGKGYSSMQEAMNGLDKLDFELMNEQHRLAQPTPHHFELVPAP